MPSKEELISSIQPGMKLTKALFLSIYANEITYPGFAIQALDKLESIGSTMAREHYNNIVAEYEAKHNKELKSAAKWLRKQWEREYEDKKRKAVNEENWEIIQKKRELLEKKKVLLQMSKR